MKNTNFKKVLALVLSLAMMLSVCTMGFTANAEEVDLSYYVINDTTMKTWGSEVETMVLTNYEGHSIYRLGVNKDSRGHFALSGKDPATDYSSVNTFAHYIANETGKDLPVAYHYYGDNGGQVGFLKEGYAYLLDENSGDILPLYSKTGYYTIPAGVKGYLIYDLSNAENYGYSNIKLDDGSYMRTVDVLKNEAFTPMHVFAQYTEDMIGKAWYMGEVAVSTKTVEELAKYLSGAKVVAYNYNMASVRYMDADENIMYWGLKMDTDGNPDGNAFPNIVDYDDFDGKGSEFTFATKAGGIIGRIDIRDSFRDTRGTDLPFAIDKAKAYKYDVSVEGKVPFELLIAGEGNYILGTKYYVSKDGSVIVDGGMPNDFEGTVYCVFDELAVKHQWSSTDLYTWADYVNVKLANKAFNMAMYTGESGTEGSTITFGGFSFIYDTTGLESIIEPENLTVLNGSETPKRGANSTIGTYNGRYDLEVGDKYAFTRKADATALNDWFYMNGNNCAKIAVNNPENVNALSLRAYLPDVGADYSVQIAMSDWDMDYYRGAITAINYDGTEYTAPAVTTGSTKITLPSGFDGIIILEVKNAEFTTNWNDGGKTKTYQGFAAYYAATTFCGVQLRIGAGSKAVDYLELDELKIICQDIDSYISDFKSGKEIAEINAAVAEREAAKEEAILKNTNIVSKVDGSANNTSNSGTNYKSAIEYVTNESEDGFGAKMTYSLASVYNESEGKDVDTNPQVYNAIDTSGLDLHNIVGFTYRANVVTPNGKPFFVSYQINEQQNGLVSPTIYLLSDDGEITTYDKNKGFNKNFTGTVVVLLNKGIAVSAAWGSSKGEHTWPEFVDFYSSRTPGPINRFNFWVTYSGAVEDYADTYFEYDSISVIYDENPIVKEIDARYDTEKYFVPINDLTRTTFTEYNSFTNHTGRYSGYTHTAPFTPSFDNTVDTPAGVAYKFTRVETEITATREFKIKNRSNLTKDELKEKEAIAYWVKVPEGETLGLSKVIGGESDVIQTSLMTYDVVTGETKLIGGGEDLILSGFEGYVILPLQSALVGKPGTGYDINGDKVNDLVGPISYSDFIDAKGISQLYFYMAGGAYKDITTAFWMGEFQFVDSLSGFMAEIGAETVAGDANNDTVVDVRDLVRLKKFNADAKTAIAYQNADVDNNGLIDTAADLIASRKQNLGVDYEAPEKDESLAVTPDVMVGFYHGAYGTWDKYASHIADENDILNAYTSFGMYELTELKKIGGAGWMYLHKSHGGEPVFGTKESGYDNSATELNEAWKVALDTTIQKYKDQGVWNQVAGFHTEEILMSAASYMSQDQYAIMTKYLRDTYGKRVLAVLSSYEVRGSESKGIPAATPETYEFVTDIGYDLYGYDEEANRAMLNDLKTNTGDRTDIKYWLLPTAYCGKAEDGTPSRTDASIAAEIKMFDKLFADTTLIPEDQRGGILFYTFQTFYDGGYSYGTNYGSFGLDLLMRDYQYDLTAQAIADMAAKYVK